MIDKQSGFTMKVISKEEVCSDYFKYADLMGIYIPRKVNGLTYTNMISTLLSTFKSFCDINNYSFVEAFPTLLESVVKRIVDINNKGDYSHFYPTINFEVLKKVLGKTVDANTSSKLIINYMVNIKRPPELSHNSFITSVAFNHFLSTQIGNTKYVDSIVNGVDKSVLINSVGRFLSTFSDEIYKYLLAQDFLSNPNMRFYTNKNQNSEIYKLEESRYFIKRNNMHYMHYMRLNENLIKEYLTAVLCNNINEQRTFNFIEKQSVDTTLNMSTLSKMLPGIMTLSSSRDIKELKKLDLLVDLDTAISRVESLKSCFKFSNRYSNASSDIFDASFAKFLENVYGV